MRNNPQYIVIHTLAFRGSAGVAEVDAWHKARGWSGIGYHGVIRRNGEWERGRGESEVGAHCKDGGMNRKSIGIALEGHGDHERWTIAQTTALLSRCLDIMSRYGMPPENVIGHREAGANKTCPGSLINMDDFRDMLRAAPQFAIAS